jgi:branched-chain amino acid transport system permease protein
MMIWSRNPLAFPQIVPNQIFQIADATITLVQIAIIASSIVMMVALTLLVYHTKLGVVMRATSQNAHIAGLMGIDINYVIAATFMLGAALAAVAGVMVGSYYGIAHYTMGSLLGLKAFAAAVLGGMLLGIVEALGAGYIGDLTDNVFGSNYQDVFAFLVLIAVLVFRPSGLLGERVGDRA